MTEVIDREETEMSAEESEKAERSRKLRQAYSNATTRLREAHRDEFDNLYAQEAEQLGVDYTPRLSPEAKAEAELKALLQAHPSLIEKVDKWIEDSTEIA